LHKRLKTEHVNAVNAAIENGEVPPKSKGTDLVTRVAVAFNAIDFFIASLLNEEPTNNPPEQITEACYQKAVQYVDYLHAQKEMFANFIKEIVETSKEKPRPKPTELDITAAILRFPGRLVTYQAFKKFAPRCLKSVQKQGYHHCTQRLQQYGRVAELRVPRCAQKMHVFIKNQQLAAQCTMLARAIQRKNFGTIESTYYRKHSNSANQCRTHNKRGPCVNVMDHYPYANVRTRSLLFIRYISMGKCLFLSKINDIYHSRLPLVI